MEIPKYDDIKPSTDLEDEKDKEDDVYNKSLCRLYQQGNKEALDELLKHNIDFITKYSKTYAKRSLHMYMHQLKMITYDDIANENIIAFIEFVKRIDVNSNMPFKTLLVALIKNNTVRILRVCSDKKLVIHTNKEETKE